MKKIALFGGSFNPIGTHHINIIKELVRDFDEVIVVLCGHRPDKATTNDIEPIHRAIMVDIALRGLSSKVKVDYSDLIHDMFTRTHKLDKKYSKDGEVWHVVGMDLIYGGARGESEIQASWQRGKELWCNLNFAVVEREGYKFSKDDLPPHAILIKPDHSGSSTEIRNNTFNHKSIDGLVTSEVKKYIEKYNLYRGVFPQPKAMMTIEDPGIKIVLNERDEKARNLRDNLKRLVDEDNPNLIVVIGGDGTMLRAIRKYWQLRLPFLGINTGHRGYLLNDGDVFTYKNFVVYQLPLLQVDTRSVDGRWRRDIGFADAWLERREGQSAWIEVEMNNGKIKKLIGDGILVSTSAGSTGYARNICKFSLPPYAHHLILAGMNIAEPVNWRDTIISRDATIKLKNLDIKKRPLRGFVDGVLIGEVERMNIKQSRIAAVELAFVPDLDIIEKHSRLNMPYLSS
ncbi:hypothetical protein A2331_02120 [Candidatus Falkowbacteria bacterium RIFOXYB2_FULL_34_18]|uniref:nicotinate-nucleotide adenylyltransferase n=1 Tax=Candidatus Falkowbacteria bacterium RIFOXYD2_FULL_34_120 TaxID=1798007 RepID=A0A1F5TQV0_9BACT|nr:MAG: hypothetical protein A2331_02120 [Candidatus Falkowbacteria bacterium RIFOXYB2_FULL_34_18]OGF29535.1 MAG: hypothetical protein A2500_02410 [Candidatus Falkowbacteria bacterium RIFOXYC12_FULL_34_55]OGF36855.1 MAG: hypothetical protein A2466_06560 [Candidatus Falkowbacteria bacterium RIFOXYC2_FULL_34_220]OGF39054.1 MAG: hypothetical protein A2515_04565 [Candidatus Falkowbacteria bacterium RIFOXYD12_FULL_34_57]OGF41293.1 MAG: hypothetical protein A2531_00325 [Candidatus Falkowbacteria bact